MKQTCIRCGGEFKRLDIHLKSAKPCEVQYIDIPRDEIMKNYTELLEEYKKIKARENISCKFCGKQYNHQSSLCRHMNTKHSNILNNVSIAGNHNDSIVGDHNTISGDTNITINNFGSESELTYDEIVELLDKDRENMFRNYVIAKYIKRPENRNVLFTHPNANFAKVYRDGKWVFKQPSAVACQVLDNASMVYNDFLNKYVEKNNIEFVNPKNDKEKRMVFTIDRLKIKIMDVEEKESKVHKTEKKNTLFVFCEYKDDIIETHAKLK